MTLRYNNSICYYTFAFKSITTRTVIGVLQQPVAKLPERADYEKKILSSIHLTKDFGKSFLSPI
jgi:hypothetical protein